LCQVHLVSMVSLLSRLLGSPVSSSPQGYRRCQVFCGCLSIAGSEQIQSRRLGRSIPVPVRGAVVLMHTVANRFGLGSAQLRFHAALCRGLSRPHSMRHAPSSAHPYTELPRARIRRCVRARKTRTHQRRWRHVVRYPCLGAAEKA